VAFTLDAIQNPDSRSPLASSWQGVKYEIRDDYTIVLKLPQPLNSFLDSTTVGVLPRHLLESVDPGSLREADFNQAPIGTGPFKIKYFAPAAKTIDLEANAHYHFGRPRLNEFEFKFFDNSTDALAAFAAHQVTSPGRVGAQDMHSKYLDDAKMVTSSFTLPEEEVLFFDTTDKALASKDLRRVLSSALDRQAILDKANASQGIVVSQPLLPGQLGYTSKYAPARLDVAAARSALEQLGWAQPRGSAIRVKDGAKLNFKLATLAGGDLERAAQEVREQYAQIGVGIEILAVTRDQLQQTYMRPRNFQMLLYGINLGSDPDVYSFWHSSQAKDPGVNLSSYNSTEADRALEAARIKSDALVRQGKYDTFLKAWNADAPAAVLYEQSYVYATRSSVTGISARNLVSPADRFYNVERWTILQRFAN
jgi:peptide/nickel transport system substrate-binding protein